MKAPSEIPSTAMPSLSVLHLEDNADDAELVQQLLQNEWPGCQVHCVKSRETFLRELNGRKLDLILSDFSMPHFDGLSALELAQDNPAPFIFLSGTLGEDNAVRALHRGATDYVLKDRPARLIPAIRRALNAAHTERKRSEAETRIREQAEYLNQARDAIIAINPEHEIVYWNRGAERMFGWSAADTADKTLAQIFGQAALVGFGARQEAFDRDEWHGEVTLPDKAGRLLIIDSRVSLLRDAENRPTSHLVIGTDVTEQRKLEREFLRAQRLESIGILAGGIAHDLNNVLAPVLMSVNLISQRVDDKEVRRLTGILERSVQRGASLIRQILTFARGNTGERTELALGPLIREIAAMLGETLPRTIAFETDLAVDLRPVLADSTQLSQAIMNLCINARDAMPSGGRLLVRALNVNVGSSTIRAHPHAQPGPHVLLTVEDTGTGIPPEIMDRIFDPFFTTKGAGKGTGLGLSTVLGIVKAHGGFLEVQSDIGHGTQFSLYLPATLASGAPLSPDPAGATPAGHGETVLIIDDEAPIRETLGLLLENYGYRTLVAADGLTGLGLFHEHRAEIGAVITDLMMPTMQGSEVIAELRTIDPQVPIIAMSGASDASSLPMDTSGRLKFLRKPMTGDELLRTLKSILRQTRPPA